MEKKSSLIKKDSGIFALNKELTPAHVGLQDFGTFREYIDFLFPRLVTTDRETQHKTIEQYFAKDSIFIDPFVRVCGIEKVKFILGLIGPTCADAQLQIMDVFVQDRSLRQTVVPQTEGNVDVTAPFNLPSRPDSNTCHKHSDFVKILPPATLSSSENAAVILQTDVVHEYVFKDILPFRFSQLFTGQSFAYRSVHKTYINSEGKIIQHEEIYSIREFLENFTAIRWMYRFYSWSNELLWQPSFIMDKIIKYYS